MGQMDHRDIFRTRLTGYVALFWFTRGISFFHSEFSDFLESDRKAHSSAYRLTTLCLCKIRIVTTRTFLFYASVDFFKSNKKFRVGCISVLSW